MQPEALVRRLASVRLRHSVGFIVLISSIPWIYVLYQDIQTAQTAPEWRIEGTDERSLSDFTISVEDLKSAYFFGATPAPQTSQAQQTFVPETQMKLQLQGVIASSVVGEGRALIAPTGQRARYYGINDELPGGATVHNIDANQVVLSRNGMLETLSFLKKKGNLVSGTIATTSIGSSSLKTDDQSLQYQQRLGPEIANHVDDKSSFSGLQVNDSISIKERLHRLREARALE